MAQIQVLQSIEFEDGTIEIVFKPKMNRLNLVRALLHLKSIIYGKEITSLSKCRYNLYGNNEYKWQRAKQKTLIHFAVEHVEDIPIDRIEEANDYCISVIDEMYKDWSP